jgi:ribonuclease Z
MAGSSRSSATDHVGTTELAQLAEDAGVRTLVLTHQVPGFDNDDARADLFFAGPVGAIFTGELVTAKDGERIAVELAQP